MEKEITIHFTPKDEILFKVNKNLGDFNKNCFIAFEGMTEEKIIELRKPYYMQVNKYGEKVICQPLDALHIWLLRKLNIISVIKWKKKNN